MTRHLSSRRCALPAMLLVFALALLGAPAAHAESALFDLTSPAPAQTDPDGDTVELGVRVTADAPFVGQGIAFYRAADRPLAGARVHLWERDRLVASGQAAAEPADGWVKVAFDDGPVTLRPGVEYVASYTARSGGYVATQGFFGRARSAADGALQAPVDAGVYR